MFSEEMIDAHLNLCEKITPGVWRVSERHEAREMVSRGVVNGSDQSLRVVYAWEEGMTADRKKGRGRHLWLSDEVYNRLKLYALSREMKISQVVEEVLDDEIPHLQIQGASDAAE